MEDFKLSCNSLTVMVLNAQDLFLFADKYRQEQGAIKEFSEIKWQLMSSSLFSNKPKKKCLELAKVILKNQPSIVMMTEVGGIESLQNFSYYLLNDEYEALSLPSNSDRGIDLGYLVKKDFKFKTSLKSYKDFKLQAPSHYFSRDVLQLNVESNDKLEFIFLLTHIKSKLDLKKSDFEGRKRRKDEIEGVIRIYESLLSLDVPILIGGDFNGIAIEENTEEEFLPLYEKTKLRDVAFWSKIPIEDRLTYLYVTKGGEAIKQQIDYLFIDEKWSHLLETEETSFLRYFDLEDHLIPLAKRPDQRAHQPSDHFPLLAKIRFKC